MVQGQRAMNIVIHIGQPKTGTTAIQRVLFQNQDALLQQGFLYPTPHGGIVNHGVMTVPIMGEVQRSLVKKIGGDYQAGLRTAVRAWAEMGAQARATRPHTVILSSEFIFRAQFIEQIAVLAARHFGTSATLTFIGYLRRPSVHYVSVIQQIFKASHVLPPVREISISQFDRFAAMGKLRLREYAHKALEQGDIVADFCAQLGIDLEQLTRKAQAPNVSLRAESIVLLQAYRQAHHADKEDVFTEDTQDLVKRLRRAEKQDPDLYTRPVIRAEYAQVLDQESQTMRILKDRFGIDLTHDHGVPAANARELTEQTKVTDILPFDPELLAKLRNDVGVR